MESRSTHCLLCLNYLSPKEPTCGKGKNNFETKCIFDGITDECDLVNSQLNVIFVLRKLLDIPTDVCIQFLENFGNPSSWIAYCASCSVFIEEGRKLCSQLALLQGKLEKVQKNLVASIANSSENSCSSSNPVNDATQNIRAYIIKARKKEIPVAEKLGSSSTGDFSTGDFPFSSHIMPNINYFVEDTVTDEDIGSKTLMLNEEYNSYEQEVDDATSNTEHPNSTTMSTIMDPFTGNEMSQATTDRMTQNRSHKNTTFSQIGKIEVLVDNIEENQFQFTYKVGNSEKLVPGSSQLIKKERVGEKPFECNICGESFAGLKPLSKHKKVHGETLVNCESCGKSFNTLTSLRVHIMNVHMERFKCLICRKLFTRSNSLKEHLLTHDSKTRRKKVDINSKEWCPVCIRNNSPIKKRGKCIHKKKALFQCEICRQRFVYQSAWERHMPSHGGTQNEDYILP